MRDLDLQREREKTRPRELKGIGGDGDIVSAIKMLHLIIKTPSRKVPVLIPNVCS